MEVSTNPAPHGMATCSRAELPAETKDSLGHRDTWLRIPTREKHGKEETHRQGGAGPFCRPASRVPCAASSRFGQWCPNTIATSPAHHKVTGAEVPRDDDALNGVSWSPAHQQLLHFPVLHPCPAAQLPHNVIFLLPQLSVSFQVSAYAPTSLLHARQ